MRLLLSSFGLAIALFAVSASAQTVDPHAGHHPADNATTGARPADVPCPCPMMTRHGMSKPMPGARPSDGKDHMKHCRDMPQPDHDAGDGR
ncbi:hypothetical protein [Sphingobium sp.]|uniref:hypothetical protein n=1 Tax=Sphingobium sp. TaxID=1912891 RepID=UPI0035C7118B